MTSGPETASDLGEVTLRPATDEDRDLLFRVYAATREDELALVDWPAEQKDAFLRQQFEAQDRHYREHYPGARFLVVERQGEAVGRFYVHHREGEIRLMDVALLPAARGRGIGSRLVRDLMAEAAASGRRLTIHVERFNRALSLYRRLGFRVAEDKGVYLFLEWLPAGGGAE
jgi:ribosomal protein S18 acetylase RimI-like enzyme